jgi:hypothetical protein
MLTRYVHLGFPRVDIFTAAESIRYHLTDDLMAPVKAQRQHLLAHMQKSSTKEAFVALPHDPGQSTGAPIAGKKSKTKTRGLSGPDSERSSDEVTSDATYVAGAITLPKRSFVVLHRLFPETTEERSKSTDWQVFVDSMVDAGFSVKNKGGSEVVFELSNGGRIAFHRPHPESTIDPIVYRIMGKRMNKWFGWVRETFVLAKK